MKKSLLSISLVFAVIFGAAIPSVVVAYGDFLVYVEADTGFAEGDNLVHIEADPYAEEGTAVGYITVDVDAECEEVTPRRGTPSHGWIIQTIRNQEDCDPEDSDSENVDQPDFTKITDNWL